MLLRHRRALVVAATAAALVGAGGAAANATVPVDLPLPLPPAPALAPVHPGLDRLLALGAAAPSPRAIVSLPAVPTDAVTAALGSLGLEVQPMHQLPLAVVEGPVAALTAAVQTGIATDVWPDERIQLLDTASSDAMGAAPVRAAGFTGRGVTVAVVDSGCDASHPDLADHVVHNVKLVSGEYANQPADPSTTLVLPVEEGPYQNTDLSSGHGTHVAGIIAADGTTGPDHLGVAPDADLVCYSIGEVLFTTAVVTAYDDLLTRPDLWGVDVVNNSWGNSYQQFDPTNPVAVATKSVADRGVAVVFAAGNSGEGQTEATLNPFSQAPWVVSVAASSLDHQRGSFSSNGLRFDNSAAAPIGDGGHTTFAGERIGLVHPDVAAPGVDIGSSCDSLGTVVGPCPAGGEQTTASGTSMASPHVAGALAVLRQANPALTPAQLQSALQVTARPVHASSEDGTPANATLPFWQVGFGDVDLNAALSLVRSANAARRIGLLQATADRSALLATGEEVLRSDFWTYAAPILSLGTDTHSYQAAVDPAANRVKVTIAFPSEAGLAGDVGLTSYTVTIRDASGRVLGTTERGAGSASAVVSTAGAAPGPWTFEVVGDRSVSDPDTIDSDSALGDTITLQVAQLRDRPVRR